MRLPSLWKIATKRSAILLGAFVTVLLISSIASAGILGQRRRCRTAITSSQPAQAEQVIWHSLYDGRLADSWKVTQFGGQGDVEGTKDQIIFSPGATLTGITYQGKFPQFNYEIELEAMRVEGIDFFCGLTFPVKEAHCSLIVGGWAGAVVGLSSINGLDASENETTSYRTFKEKKWYPIRVRVTETNISVWIDGKQAVNQSTANRTISTRPEVDLNKPLGFCAWQTKAALRNIRWRELE
jgi:hypothetical protein